MKFTAIRPVYLPPLEFFWQMAQVDLVLFADHLQYVKRSPITVYAPLTEDENQTLHIPVRHHREAQSISQKETDAGSNWKRKHWQSIRHLFHDAPYAYHYLPQIAEWFTGQEEITNLSDFLFLTLTELNRFLHLPVKWIRSSQELSASEPDSRQVLISVAQKYHAKVYVADPVAVRKGWIDAQYLQSHGISWQAFEAFPTSHLFQSYRRQSVLGFLLQFGPEAGYLIRQYLPERKP